MTTPAAPQTPAAESPAAPVKKGRRKWPWILAAVLVLFVAIGIAISGPSTPDPGNPANGNMADLFMAYDAQNPPAGLPRSFLDPAAKDACMALAKATNPLPGEKEKYATAQTVTGIQYVESNGTVPTQPFVIQLPQAQAIVAAAEKVYCPSVTPQQTG